MLADGIDNAQLLIRVDDAGNIIEKTELPNVIQLDYLKRSLQTLAEQNRDATTLQFTTKGLRYNRLARDLRQAIGDAVVDQDGVKIYNKAVNLGGGKIAEQNAYRIGNEALRAKTGVENV